MRPARRAIFSVLVVPNVKVRMEAQYPIPPVSLHDLLRESFTFAVAIFDSIQRLTLYWLALLMECKWCGQNHTWPEYVWSLSPQHFRKELKKTTKNLSSL